MANSAVSTNTQKRRMLYRIIAVGLMAALAYVGNYLQIKIPNGVLVTRIHLGNSMCLLAGLLFGGISGGLASGIGAAFYDLFDPVYIVSAPYTFVSKFAMGFVAGVLRRKGKNEKTSVIVAAILGQITYIVLYLIKTYFTIIILGGTSEAAWTAVGTNAITSSINGVLAVIISVPLYFVISRALKNTAIYSLIAREPETEEKPKLFNPLTIGLTAFAVVVTIIFSINLAATNKIKKAEAEKEAAYQQQIDDLNKKLDYLYEQVGVEFPEEEPVKE
ncbi:MAG: ECF transporter S component [Oscillospiraceae bacterium]